MGAVPLGSSSSISGNYATGTFGSSSSYGSAVNNINYRNTAVRKSLFEGAKAVFKTGAKSLVRFNPYLAGAMLLYEGYDLYKGYNASSSSSSSSDVAVPIGSSSDNTSTVPSFNVPPFDSSGTLLTDVVNYNNNRGVDFVGSVAQNSSKINDSVSRLLDISSSYEGSNLLEVLISNNEKTNKILMALVSAVNNFAVSSSVSSSSISTNLGFIGSVLSTQAQQDAMYYNLGSLDDYAKSSLTPPDVNDSLNNSSLPDDSYTPPTFDNSNPFNIQYTYEQQVLSPEEYRRFLGLDSGADLSEFEYETPALGGIDIAPLVSAINPASREEFFEKSNQISDYKMTPVPAVDLDGNTITDATLSPLEVERIKNASTARKHTDENNFELDEDDFDMWSLPNMDFLDDIKYSNIYSDVANS
ncbi:hypothetical protein [Sulfurimonas sp. NW9]|uniref:hypothetical protein n=1 Tax=Sulfurimonas sp. NW9 TaxID=2922728 RepID=UPI003DA8F65A